MFTPSSSFMYTRPLKFTAQAISWEQNHVQRNITSFCSETNPLNKACLWALKTTLSHLLTYNLTEYRKVPVSEKIKKTSTFFFYHKTLDSSPNITPRCHQGHMKWILHPSFWPDILTTFRWHSRAESSTDLCYIYMDSSGERDTNRQDGCAFCLLVTFRLRSPGLPSESLCRPRCQAGTQVTVSQRMLTVLKRKILYPMILQRHCCTIRVRTVSSFSHKSSIWKQEHKTARPQQDILQN